MKRRNKGKRIISILLTAILFMITVSGCAGNNTPESESGRQGNAAESASAEPEKGQQTAEGTAMGRYVEKVTDLSEEFSDFSGGSGLYTLSDGRLVITDNYSYFLASKDNGNTWEKDDRPWLSRLREIDAYISGMGVGADNRAGVIFVHDDQEQEEGAKEEPGGSLNRKLLMVAPDGTENPVEIALTEDDSDLYQIYMADNGRTFVTVIGSGNIYEIKEDGSSKLFLTLEAGHRPELIQFQGDLMIIDAYGTDGLLIYDMEKEEYIEDEVLNEFVNTNYKNRNSQAGMWYGMYFFPGEDGVLYLAGAKGLYRHVIGGSAIEQIIDGSLCTFNNPAYSIVGMTALENNEFLALFTNGRLVRFVYDPDIPTVPTERLKVYSLKENRTIRQAITLYQTDNPAVYAEYEIGMAEGSSVTREDALKSLNTKIMAGEGPDVLILDGMPEDSYIEKGLLLDLSPIVSEAGGGEEFFGNITEAMMTGDKLYAMPCEIQLPVILGREKYVSGAVNLEGIADAVEKLRSDNPGKDLLGICTEKGIMRLFAMVCVPGWIKEDGDIDREAVAEFLTQTKRIYDAQMEGLPKETVSNYNSLNESYLQEIGISRDDSDYLRTSVSPLYFIANLSYMECGALNSAYSYADVTSTDRAKGFEDCVLIPMKGQAGNVFCAKTLLGINAASENTGAAQDFIKICLGKENQSGLFNGFAVNKTAFKESFVPAYELEEDGIYTTTAMSSADGIYAEMATYWPDEKLIGELEKQIEAVDTPYIEEAVLEEAVYEEGIMFMQGKLSLEETVDAVEKKVSIYMSE